ncbi:hypothetical protein DFH06DRAFT_1129391 [Mycena polygramma]|nr:hypothetical protein DFH06DRAFT_1129391 [Mycena polygramma]
MGMEGYWGWDMEAQGTTLRTRTCTSRDGGLKAQADVKITESSLACHPHRPARTRVLLLNAGVAAHAAALADAANTPERPHTIPLPLPYTRSRAATTPSSTSPSTSPAIFPLISPSNTSTSTDESCDISFSSFNLPPPLPPLPLGPGLGPTSLFTQDGLPFDGLGVLSFGVCGSPSPPLTSRTASRAFTRTHTAREDTGLGLSRTFLEEVVWTWEKDSEHQFLTVIDEEWDEGEEDGVGIWAQEREQDADTNMSRSSRTSTRGVERDTISSGLKRTRRAEPPSASLIPTSGARRGVWRA